MGCSCNYKTGKAVAGCDRGALRAPFRLRAFMIVAMLALGVAAALFVDLSAHAAEADPVEAPAIASQHVTVTVQGMVCSFCASGLKKAFGKHDAVKNLVIRLESRTVDFDLTPADALSDEAIRKVVNDAGYDVASLARK